MVVVSTVESELSGMRTAQSSGVMWPASASATAIAL